MTTSFTADDVNHRAFKSSAGKYHSAETSYRLAFESEFREAAHQVPSCRLRVHR